MGRRERAGPGAIGGNSAIENNLIVNCPSYAIKIGSGSTAAAWNPFDDAFGDNSGGNPIIPVRNNMVWDCGWNPTGGMGGTGAQDDAYAFQGDNWYRSDVDFVGFPSQYGAITSTTKVRMINGEVIEQIAEPLFVSYDPNDPSVIPDFRPASGSPALAAGSPYRIDLLVVNGEDWIMRRSVGAHASTNANDYQALGDTN